MRRRVNPGFVRNASGMIGFYCPKCERMFWRTGVAREANCPDCGKVCRAERRNPSHHGYRDPDGLRTEIVVFFNDGTQKRMFIQGNFNRRSMDQNIARRIEDKTSKPFKGWQVIGSRSNPSIGLRGMPHTWVTKDGTYVSEGDTVEFWHNSGGRGDRPTKHVAKVARMLIFDDHVQVKHGTFGTTVDDTNFVRVVKKAARRNPIFSVLSNPYEAHGPVRGSCGHRHKTAESAARCVWKDNRDVRRGHGRDAYSDRVVRQLEVRSRRKRSNPLFGGPKRDLQHYLVTDKRSGNWLSVVEGTQRLGPIEKHWKAHGFRVSTKKITEEEAEKRGKGHRDFRMNPILSVLSNPSRTKAREGSYYYVKGFINPEKRGKYPGSPIHKRCVKIYERGGPGGVACVRTSKRPHPFHRCEACGGTMDKG